jgi:type IV pilus assembly protein PilV
MKQRLKPLTATPPAARRQRGIALLEVMIAIVILGIGLLGTIGLQARAYSALSDAGMRAEATLAAEKLIGTISADLPNVLAYNGPDGEAPNEFLRPWVAETQASIPGAVTSVTVVAQPAAQRAQVTVSIQWQRKASDEPNVHRVTAYVAM